MKNNDNYPKTIRVGYFKEDGDTRNSFEERYAIEEVVNNMAEESDFYNSINHEANVKIEIF